MPRFVTIGYGDRTGYDATDGKVLEAAHATDRKLSAEGAILGIARQPVQVRNPGDKGVTTKDGPYLKCDLPLAGFGIIEAANLDEAIGKISKSPCAVAQGVVEVWPLEEPKP